jgi:L-aspartate oxidase
MDVHTNAELAPRDVVARAIHRQIVSGHKVFLDCRQAIGAKFAGHFPTVHAACISAGIDPACMPIPVAPAAHYHMGGIASDASGRSSLEGLWVAGECASTGLHGANRLASNSLLEGLVFGARVAEDVKGMLKTGGMRGLPPAPAGLALSAPPHVLRDAMSRYVGLERSGDGLRQGLAVIERLERQASGDLVNMLAAARLVTVGALAREESRGAHARSDFPQTTPEGVRRFSTLDAAPAVQDSLRQRAHS